MLQSLNGIIAKPGDSDDLMWGGKEDKKHFSKLTKEIGTVVMGSTTFEASGSRALPGRHNIVMTKNPQHYAKYVSKNLEFTSELPREIINRLHTEGLDQVAVIGGGLINSKFLSENLIDEIYLTIAPWIFTKGTPVVAETQEFTEHHLQLIEHKLLDEQSVLLHYKILKNSP